MGTTRHNILLQLGPLVQGLSLAERVKRLAKHQAERLGVSVRRVLCRAEGGRGAAL